MSFKGFGSFVEKTVMPYISTTPAKLLNPCTGDQNCTSPFSYKNVLKLTSDGKRFNTLVGQQQISGNLDSPEGGFDAIMQVAVCGVSKKIYISCWLSVILWGMIALRFSIHANSPTIMALAWRDTAPINAFTWRCVKRYFMSPCCLQGDLCMQ